MVWDAHEYLPGVKPWRDNARWLPAHCAYVREYAPYADAVITVSPTWPSCSMRTRLAERPAVVLNAPSVDPDRMRCRLTSVRCAVSTQQARCLSTVEWPRPNVVWTLW